MDAESVPLISYSEWGLGFDAGKLYGPQAPRWWHCKVCTYFSFTYYVDWRFYLIKYIGFLILAKGF